MHDFKSILQNIGTGNVSNTAYDTAWVARLIEYDTNMSNRALQWLVENQLEDGSWGVHIPQYYHDRVISTLAAMIALNYRGRRHQDRMQINFGRVALENITTHATRRLQAESNARTVGFEVIVPTLVAEAEKLGILKQQGDRILGRLGKYRDLKMSKLAGIQISRHVTIAHSAEMAGTDLLHMFDVDNLQEDNGSVANSPSATAYFALYVNPGEEKALQYLRNIQSADGGVPSFAPFDIFERLWVLWNIAITGLQDDPDIRPLCEPHLDYIQDHWKPGKGLGFSAHYSLTDGDDTSVGFEILSRFGRPVDTDALLGYEEDDWFRCYGLEINPSIDVNIHVLGSLRELGYEKDHPTIKKIIKFLHSMKQDENFWFDKWHVSPFYTTAHAVIACRGYDDELCKDSIQWILDNQNSNGAWGYYGYPTAEETAYCIQALKLWEMHGGIVPPGRIDLAAFWLKQHAEPPYPPFWMDKSLYHPELLVQMVILSALKLAEA